MAGEEYGSVDSEKAITADNNVTGMLIPFVRPSCALILSIRRDT